MVVIIFILLCLSLFFLSFLLFGLPPERFFFSVLHEHDVQCLM